MLDVESLGLITADLIARLAMDVVAVGILAYGMYFRRHRQRELFVVLTMFNVGLFVALQIISAGTISLGVGFGLFAILAILRLRSEPFGYSEMGYFFASLVLALVAGIDVGGLATAAVLSAVVLLAAAVADSPRLVRPISRTEVTLEQVFTDESSLRRHLEERFDARVVRLEVQEIDFVRETTRAVVGYRRLPPRPSIPEETLRASGLEAGG
jgi:hypothetical protein